MSVTLVNNTGIDISLFIPTLIDCVANAKALPDDISDIFSLKIVKVDGADRGIVDIA